MIWKKLFIWEKLCLWLFKISTGMQHANLRSMACNACHCWNGMSAQFGYHSNYDLQIYTKHLPPMQLPGHQSITPSVAVTTQLWCNSISTMACNACHAPEIFIIHTSANFEKSKTQISQTNNFSQINKFFVFNTFNLSNFPFLGQFFLHFAKDRLSDYSILQPAVNHGFCVIIHPEMRP